MIITADLVVEVMRCVESLLAYFSRAPDLEAKVLCLCGPTVLLNVA